MLAGSIADSKLATISTANKVSSSAIQLDGSTLSSSGSGLRVAALTASKVAVSDASGNLTASSVSTTTLGYLDATSSVQTQINTKSPSASPTFTGTIGTPLTASKVLTTDSSSNLAASTVSTTTLGYLDATSSIQTQLNAKAPSASPTFSGTIGTPLTASKALQTDASGNLQASSVSTTTLGYLDATSSVQTQLNSKISAVSQDTAPALGAALNTSSYAIYSATGVKEGSSATQFQMHNYVHSQTLTASQTGVEATNLTFLYGTYGSCIVEYQITEATTNAVRCGQLMVSTDGTNVAIADSYTETADVGVTWTGSISGSNAKLNYTTTANNKTMRAMQKLFLV
jgi:hypothetical protein